MSSQINTPEKIYPLEGIFSQMLVNAIYKDIMASRKCVGEDDFSYDVLERPFGEKTYIITTRHIPVSESMKYGNSSCNKCYGSGKKIINIEKSKIANTKDFVMLSSESTRGLSEEQIVEQEKKNKFWRVMLPCSCAIKRMLKKGMYIYANDMNNIVVEITCVEKCEVVEKV